jgi:class 3 adenylate cyclase/pimeloyl-ACP methyl ester carboxylesterase
MEPEIRYAPSGGVAIAYQAVGTGETDLVFVPDFFSNLVYGWESPYWRPFYERLAASFRVILFDKRGTGVSDRGGSFPTLETRMEDLHAVMRAAGSQRALIFGSHEGCSMATLFAATYPEQTSALALFHPRLVSGPDEAELAELPRLRDQWGTSEFCDELLEEVCPTLAATPEGRRWFRSWLRVGASPAMGYELNRAFAETNLRDIYAAVRVPALVLYRDAPGDTDEYRAVAREIPGGRAMRVSGHDYWGVFLSPDIADELERFAAGKSAPAVPDSVLTTVLFTDIVGSTVRAQHLGDRAWRDMLAAHHSAVRRELVRFRGEERDTAGDGFFATFDGPARAVRCAAAIIEAVRPLGLELRAGVHTGECELHEGKVTGIAVATGARVCSTGGPGEVTVTRTVKDITSGSGIIFEPRGTRTLKDVGESELYAVA